MDLLTTQQLRNLIENQEKTCISIYLPTFIVGSEVGQNQIRYKNLIREVATQLNQTGLRPSQIEELLAPLRKFVDETLFWKNQSQGLALFRSEENFYHYRLPLKFNELALVSGRFHIKPLLPMFSEDGLFYLLAFSKNKVRFLQGSKHTVSELDIRGVPKSLADVLKYDFPQKGIQYHTGAPRHGGTPRQGGKRDAQYFGTGASDPDEKDNILRYFRQIDRGVCEFLKSQRSPLAIAGVDYLLPIYREANRYPELVEEGIYGNPDKLSEGDLHQRAWEKVSPIFEKSQREALQRFEQLHNTGGEQTAQDLELIIRAAHDKRVESLFVATDEQQWGKFYEFSDQVEVHDSPESSDEDLLDFAAVHTLINHGTVYPMLRKDIPGQKSAAAIFRY